MIRRLRRWLGAAVLKLAAGAAVLTLAAGAAVLTLAAGAAVLTLAAGAAAAAAECGMPPAEDDALLARPAAASAILEARATVSNPEGRLWRVETDPPSYLVGTFHLKAGGVEQPGPVVERIVDAAEILFIEVDGAALEATLAAWGADPTRLFRSDGSRLSTGMTADEKARAEALIAAYGIPFDIADKIQPIILFGLLSIPPCAMAEAQGDGLDAVLEARAAAAGAEVRPLETVEEQLAALAGPEMEAMLRFLIAPVDQLTEQWFLNLAFYRQGKIAALWLYSIDQFQALAGEAEAERMASIFWERLIGSRNRRMVERMLPRLTEGGAVVAVGALHLPGEDGIVELLRTQGLAVTRIEETEAGGDAGEAPGGR